MTERSAVPRGPIAPGVLALRSYSKSWLRTDVVAGITVAAYLIPQVMAYGELAGLPAVAGFYAMLPAILMYAVFGSSRQLSVGPESTTALMTAAAVGPLALGDPARYAALAAMTAVIVGAMCLGAYVLKLGMVADLLSKPILVGYMAGVALVMIMGQMEKISGIPVSGDSFVAQFRSFVSNLGEVDALTLGFAASLVALLLLMRWRFPRLPGPLVVVLIATAAVSLLGLEGSLALVGEIPAGLPQLGLPDVSAQDIADLAYPAVGIAVVGFSDNVLTARAYANRNDYLVDTNQELMALGTANIGAGLCQGFPVSSSGSRTAIGDASGSRSQIYSLTAGLAVVFVLLFMRDVLAAFPKAALGALVVYAALLLIEFGEFKRLFGFRKDEFALSIATLVGVLGLGLLNGILVAVGLSLLVILARIARPNDAVLGTSPGIAGMHDIDDYPDATTIPGLVVYRYDSPLFFANAEDFRRRALEAAASDPHLEWFILNAEAITQLDSTAADSLFDVIRSLDEEGVRFGMARVKHELRLELERAGILDQMDPSMIFPTLPTAVAGFHGRSDGSQH